MHVCICMCYKAFWVFNIASRRISLNHVKIYQISRIFWILKTFTDILMSRGIFHISNPEKISPKCLEYRYFYMTKYLFLYRSDLKENSRLDGETNFQCGFKKTWQNVEILQKIPFNLEIFLDLIFNRFQIIVFIYISRQNISWIYLLQWVIKLKAKTLTHNWKKQRGILDSRGIRFHGSDRVN